MAAYDRDPTQTTYLDEIGRVPLLTAAEEMGRKLKVARERIRQIQNQALRKLREEIDRQDKPATTSKGRKSKR